MLETLKYIRHETDTWLEISTLVIPGLNDSPGELDRLSRWIARELGPDVPLHFSAIHPDWRMTDRPPTPPATLSTARGIAMENGLRYVYTGNVHDPEGDSTRCRGCGRRVVARDWYKLTRWDLTGRGDCAFCGTPSEGVFDGPPGDWGRRRLPVRLNESAPA